MKKLLCVLLFCIICHSTIYAQEASALDRIKAHDVLKISVKGEPDLGTTLQVSERNVIDYPLLGEVKVGGLTTGQAAQKIERLLKMYYFLDTEVSILISSSHKEKISGEPEVFQAEDQIPQYDVTEIPVYRITAYDTLQISVYGEPELGRTVQVSEGGIIRYPLLGEVEVGGLTADEAADKLEELLQKGYVVNPQVSVFIEQHGKVYVLGAVAEPGSYELRGPLTLLDVIVLAGGPEENANLATIKVIRVYHEGTEPEHIKEYVLDLEVEGKEFFLKPLDKVFVDQYGEIFVVGAVNEVGSYKLERRDLTPLDAIVFLAEGAKENANLTAVTVVRQENGLQTEYILNLENEKENKNFLLQEGDRILVKEYKNIAVFGQVNTPGKYPFRKGLTVIDAISEAGGFTDVANQNGVRVVREGGKEKRVIRVPVGHILKTGDKARDIELEEGDTVVVPESWF
ncbi:MAG: polysaccharide biosynthesis/export family protein [Candidatus Omnitrophota bacterium]|nr:MAG: polysaccharide biosynthesis/export family protein [Candidatus Omnitrophota bacterium]